MKQQCSARSAIEIDKLDREFERRGMVRTKTGWNTEANQYDLEYDDLIEKISQLFQEGECVVVI